MKRVCMLLLVLSLVMAACELKTREDKVLDSIGEYERDAYFSYGGFQDFTDYGKYFYSSVDIAQSEYFERVSTSDIERINEFIDDFEGWIDLFRDEDPEIELVLNYDFERSVIDTEDYYYIYEGDAEDYPEFGYYDVWIFDSQSNILYYFHNNI